MEAKIVAANAAKFLAKLRQEDISVPPRGRGRRTWHRERWTAYRLLVSLAKTGRLAGPLTLSKRERPDFLLTIDGDEVGIEITESTSADCSRYASIAAEEFPNALLEPAHFRWGAPRRSNEEMRRLLGQRRLTSAGWGGEAMERDWSLFLFHSIKRKIERLSRPGYSVFSQNWLAVYDNTPTHAVELDRALLLLQELIEPIWAGRPHFDEIYVEHGKTILRLTSNMAEKIALVDVWERTASAPWQRARKPSS